MVREVLNDPDRDQRHFVVSLRRGAVLPEQGSLSEQVGMVNGVDVIGSSDPKRVQVQATDDAISEVRRRFGDIAEIEEAISHKLL